VRECWREAAASVKGTGIAVRHGQRTAAVDEADAMPGPPPGVVVSPVSPKSRLADGGGGGGMTRSSIGTC